ncbi:hypothetical protein [Mangrovicoccus ximenensis]|uniref:hypothetical protein n=1 Tax=Mangrovicoccus ximenensis TaxID=1911570 RepID=UPI001F46DE0C|nr:hypothetical protein [Mangrovicoccus ximenensis]
MELLGKYVFLSEGVRGSLSKEVIAKFDLIASRRGSRACAAKSAWRRRRTRASWPARGAFRDP